MFVNRGLDFLTRDILATADDNVLLAIDDEQIAVLVEIADIAGQKVTIGGEGGGGGVGPPVIFGEVADLANADLAALALRYRLARAIKDREIDQRCRSAPG